MSNHKTPGEILRDARELRGLEQSDVAKRLRLSVQTVIDIENDDYRHFTAEIYLRGHMRSFARLVDANVVELFKSYERLGIEIESDPQIPVMVAHDSAQPAARRSKRKTILWAGFGVLFVLIVMVVLWWQEQKHHTNMPTQVIGSNKPLIVITDQNKPQKKLEKKPQSKTVMLDEINSLVKQ